MPLAYRAISMENVSVEKTLMAIAVKSVKPISTIFQLARVATAIPQVSLAHSRVAVVCHLESCVSVKIESRVESVTSAKSFIGIFSRIIPMDAKVNFKCYLMNAE